jgi:hypothetical protein
MNYKQNGLASQSDGNFTSKRAFSKLVKAQLKAYHFQPILKILELSKNPKKVSRSFSSNQEPPFNSNLLSFSSIFKTQQSSRKNYVETKITETFHHKCVCFSCKPINQHSQVDENKNRTFFLRLIDEKSIYLKNGKLLWWINF